MAESVYNPNTGDLVTEFSEIKETKLSKGFHDIPDTNLNNMAEQNQIAPRQMRTGEMRGDQQIRGMIKVEDRSGRTVVMMGYSDQAIF